jgi:hypothetical protein
MPLVPADRTCIFVHRAVQSVAIDRSGAGIHPHPRRVSQLSNGPAKQPRAFNPIHYYGTSVASADLVMTDGESLENTGVTPDETIVPSAEDLVNGRDPVMVRAAELAGITLSPEEAGKVFPYEWPKN